MFDWVREALETMDGTAVGRPSSLMPQGHRLELFVTTTDFYGYQRLLPLYDPASAPDNGHRHVLEFRFQEGTDLDQFGPGHNPALTFAARATSSFPGAFPPIAISDMGAAAEGQKRKDFIEEFFASYVASGGDPASTSFLDGGVLDNKPFGHAVRAVQRKPAWFEVQRRLLYIQPDPDERFKPPRGKRPTWLSTIWSGLSTLPREEPVLDDLLEVRAFNDRVMRVQDMVRKAAPVVEERIRKRLNGAGGDLRAVALTPGSVDWRTRVNDLAKEEGGLHYIAYARLKLSAVVEQLGLVAARLCRFPDETDQSMFVRDVVREWASRKPDILASPFGELTQAQEDFLRGFDLGYGYRRVRFVQQGVNDLYDTIGQRLRPDRADLNALKLELSALAVRMEAVMGGAGLDEVKEMVRGLFSTDEVNELLRGARIDYGALADRWEGRLDELRTVLGTALDRELQGFGDLVRSRLETAIRDWDQEASDAVLTRYVGFPLWDALIYPILKLADVGELVPVAVFRMSPADATRLDASGSKKLFGVRRSHFAAFFRRMWRESDYLWGRLDGMERMLDLIGEESNDRFREGFGAVLSEEKGSLKTLRTRIEDLAQQVARI
jgi:patatin-related protein